MNVSELAVVKVGGSLYTLPDLGTRLDAFLNSLPTNNVLLIPGGGCFADAVRAMDQVHHFNDSQAHCLAIRAMSLAGHFLAAILGDCASIVDAFEDCPEHWRKQRLPILNADKLIDLAKELPESWNVTSDSLAAFVAKTNCARELLLLKSVSLPEGMGWGQAAEQGLVDPFFPALVTSTSVHWVNLRG